MPTPRAASEATGAAEDVTDLPASEVLSLRSVSDDQESPAEDSLFSVEDVQSLTLSETFSAAEETASLVEEAQSDTVSEVRLA